MLASIIIPECNQVEFTKSCVEAIVENTSEDLYEVIIIDNASTDGTKDFLSLLDGDVKIIVNDTNLGFARACEQGVEAASGKYLVLLHNDTRPQPGWLENLVTLAETNPSAGAVGSIQTDTAGAIQVDDSIPAMLVRRNAWHAVSGFGQNGKSATCRETDLSTAILDAGYLVLREPASMVVHYAKDENCLPSYETTHPEQHEEDHSPQYRGWLEQNLSVKTVPGTTMIEVNGIQGWLMPGDVYYLYEKARNLRQKGVIVEIGSFMGLSSVVLANALLASDNLKARIYCIDTWQELGGFEAFQTVTEMIKNDQIFDIFKSNIRKTGIESFITPIREKSVAAAANFAAKSIDFLFIDGDHTYDGCYTDLQAWYPKLRRRGTLIGHDCSPDSGVRQALEQFTKEHDLVYTIAEPPQAHYIFEIKERPGRRR